QSVALTPEPHFREVAEVPPVADRTVIARQRARGERRVSGTGDGGKHFAEGPGSPPRCERLQVGCVIADQRGRETYDVQNDRSPHLTPATAGSSRSAGRRNFGDCARNSAGFPKTAWRMRES